jgi:hypothetical protein
MSPKLLLELRDEQISTFTYISNNSGLHFICNSVGYGLPYATQYTNPERYHVNGANLPQPEPNDLFMPSQADATWVLCSTPKGIVPVYIESTIVVSPTELKTTDSYQQNPMELNRVSGELKLAK